MTPLWMNMVDFEAWRGFKLEKVGGKNVRKKYKSFLELETRNGQHSGAFLVIFKFPASVTSTLPAECAEAPETQASN